MFSNCVIQGSPVYKPPSTLLPSPSPSHPSFLPSPANHIQYPPSHRRNVWCLGVRKRCCASDGEPCSRASHTSQGAGAHTNQRSHHLVHLSRAKACCAWLGEVPGRPGPACSNSTSSPHLTSSLSPRTSAGSSPSTCMTFF